MGVTRRDILMNAGKLASGLAIGGAAIHGIAEDQAAAGPRKHKLKVVVTGGIRAIRSTAVVGRLPATRIAAMMLSFST